jgi:hypothetical protein
MNARSQQLVKVCLIAILAASTGRLHSQTPDACKMVDDNDVAALVTLNQATVEPRDMGEGRNECSYDVRSSLGDDGEVTIRRYDLGSHDEAVHRMQQDLPFYFDKKPPLVKTNDPSDHVLSVIEPNGQSIEAVHGQYKVELNVSSAEDSAKAHPSWEYRLQRTALQAAGATILPTPGIAPDPVLPKRQPPSASAREAQDSTGPWFLGLLSYLWLIGPLVIFFVLYRLVVKPRMLRNRLSGAGLDGVAHIDSVEDTGVTINGNPQVKFNCTITPSDGRPPYKASQKSVVSRLVSPASQVGSSLPVKIDSNNPQVFIFVRR